MQGEWIEIDNGAAEQSPRPPSLPMQGEWIEIGILQVYRKHGQVSPHAGRVD